jgi:uncharacterized protein with GYD domain
MSVILPRAVRTRTAGTTSPAVDYLGEIGPSVRRSGPIFGKRADGGRAPRLARPIAARSQRRRNLMATYVVLVNFTDQGIRNVKESPKRYQAFKAASEATGVRQKDVWWTIGAYDIVTLIEGEEDAVTAALLKLGAAGNVRTQTLRAYNIDEFSKILGKLG